MFDKKAFMSHIKNQDNNSKMTRAGIKTSFYEEREDIQEALPAVIGKMAVGAAGTLGRLAASGARAAGTHLAGTAIDLLNKKKKAETPVEENVLNNPIQKPLYDTKRGGPIKPGGGPFLRARMGEPIENILGRKLKPGEIAGKKVTTDVAMTYYDRMQRKHPETDPNKRAEAALDMATKSTPQTTPESEFRRQFVGIKKAKERLKLDAGYEPELDPIMEARMKRLTKSHGKYPKGTHYCATHVEHADWGEGQTITGQHAAPDENGEIAWYNVMFEHGMETVDTENLNILLAEVHENHDHHEGEDIQEQDSPGLRDILKMMVVSRDVERGERTPGRGEDPTDHHLVGGKPRRDTGRVSNRPGEDRMSREMIASRYKKLKRYDPSVRRSDAMKSFGEPPSDLY